MTSKKFVRAGKHRYSKLGLRRKNKQSYRKSKGRDNKIRLNKAGRMTRVKVGFRSKKSERDLVKGLKRIMINNIDDLKLIKDGMVGVIARIGKRKKLEIARYAHEKKVKLKNIDIEKFIKDVEEEMKSIKENKIKRLDKKKKKDKKAKEKEKEDKEKEKGEKKEEGGRDKKEKGGKKEDDLKKEKGKKVENIESLVNEGEEKSPVNSSKSKDDIKNDVEDNEEEDEDD